METYLSLFGDRLKESRKALGLSQSDTADLVGVSREHWGRCERGIAVPGGEVLAALANAGADVRYILTGKRDFLPEPALSSEEQTMLDYFKDAPKSARRAAVAALLGAVPAGTVGGTQSQHASGEGSVQIGSTTKAVRVAKRK